MANSVSRNRTLQITAEEKEKLKKRILSLEDLTSVSPVNKTICADLFQAIDFIPNNFADLIIIDPPYNLDKKFNNFSFKAMAQGKYIQYLESWLPQVCNKLKSTGSLYICGDWGTTSALQLALSRHLTIINRITWQREKGRGAKTNWKNSMEDIWFAVKNPKEYFFDVDKVKIKRRVIAPYLENGKAKDWKKEEDGNFRVTYPSNFWDDITIPFWSMPENTPHPTQKPEKLYAKLILASSKEGDMIFDPFLGSGTTSVVAKKLNRRFCGIEIDEMYCLYTEKRLQIAEIDKAIQGYEQGVFWERNTLNFQRKQTTISKDENLFEEDL